MRNDIICPTGHVGACAAEDIPIGSAQIAFLGIFETAVFVISTSLLLNDSSIMSLFSSDSNSTGTQSWSAFTCLFLLNELFNFRIPRTKE